MLKIFNTLSNIVTNKAVRRTLTIDQLAEILIPNGRYSEADTSMVRAYFKHYAQKHRVSDSIANKTNAIVNLVSEVLVNIQRDLIEIKYFSKDDESPVVSYLTKLGKDLQLYVARNKRRVITPVFKMA